MGFNNGGAEPAAVRLKHRKERIIIGGIVALVGGFILLQLLPIEDAGNPPVIREPLWDSPETRQLADAACYDCHSNNTTYPWYSNIQPMGWLLANHIKEGKAELNFNEFGSYSERRQQSKLKSIAGQVKENEMPLASYTMLHKNARLTKHQKALIIDWALQAKDSLEQNIRK